MKSILQASAEKPWKILMVEDKDFDRAQIAMMHCPHMLVEDVLNAAGIGYHERPYSERKSQRQVYVDDFKKDRS